MIEKADVARLRALPGTPPHLVPETHDEFAARQGLLARLLVGGESRVAERLGWVMGAVLLLFMGGQLFADVMWQNEGELLAYPTLILNGFMPYRDIWMMYPPGVFLVLAGLMKLGIPALVAERGVGVLVRVAYVMLVNRAFTNSWKRISPLGLLTTFSLLFLAAEVRASPYIVGAPIVFLALLAARDRPYLSAALFVLADLVRFELGIVGVMCLASLAALRWWAAKDGRLELIAASLVLGGSSLVYGALDLLTAGKAIPQIFLIPILVINPGRRVPLFPPVFGPLGIPIELAVLLVPAAVVAFSLRRRRWYLASTNLALYGVIPQLLQHANWEHLCTTAAVVMPWSLLSLQSLLTRSDDQIGALSGPGSTPVPVRSRSDRALRWTARLCCLSSCIWPGVLMLAWFVYFSSLSPFSQFHGWRYVASVDGRTVIAKSAREARADAEVATYLARHARPNDRLFIAQGTLVNVQSNPVLLYYLAGLRPANSYLEMNPGIEDQASTQREIVRSLRPGTWVVEWTTTIGADPGTARRHGSHVFGRWIHTHATLMLKNGYYRVLRVS